ncbi:MAG: flavin reductase family protein [Betaproteobacteria bacterium]|nr:flavin reductase family protein [Betaproteobacteria bacterium]
MDQDAKKTALRMIPYGLFVLTATAKDGRSSAATINWVTQASFTPPLLVVGVKADSGSHAMVDEAGEFVLNVIPKSGKDMAYAFFKPTEVKDGKMSGYAVSTGSVVKAPVREARR